MAVLAVNAWDEDRGEVRRFVQQKKLKQRILLDGGQVRGIYRISSIPAVIWIDRQGRIVDAEFGYHGSRSLERKTRAVLERG